MKANRMLGNVDLPIIADLDVASTAAAAKHTVFVVSDLTKLAAYAAAKGVAPRQAIKVRSMTLVPEASFTGVVTNNLTLDIEQWRAGAKVATIASVTLDNTVALVAYTPYVVDAGVSSPALSAGDAVIFTIVVNGTGGSAIPATKVLVDFDTLDVGK